MISKALAVPCPPAKASWGGCGVKAGEPCVWPGSGKPRGAPHYARKKAAQTIPMVLAIQGHYRALMAEAARLYAEAEKLELEASSLLRKSK